MNSVLRNLLPATTALKRLFQADAIYGEEEAKYNDLISFRSQGEKEKEALTSRLAECEAKAEELRKAISESEKAIAFAEGEINAITQKAEGIKDKLSEINLKLVALNAKYDSAEEKCGELSNRLDGEREKLSEIAGEISQCENTLAANESTSKENIIKIRESEKQILELNKEKESIDKKLDEREKSLPERRTRLKFAQIRREQAFESYTRLESTQKSSREEYDDIINRLWEEYELSYSAAEEFRLPADKRDKMPSRLNAIKAKIRAMGNINLKAVEEYEELKTRRDFLKARPTTSTAPAVGCRNKPP